MDIYRTYNPTTRSLTKTSNVYAGQMGDSMSTVLHFDYTDISFLEDHTPYIVFAVYDDQGNPLIYGNASSPTFDGRTFEIPWEVTSRIKSQRVEYQLYFTATSFVWDGENWSSLRAASEMSAIDGIAIKPSIRPKGCCAPPAMLPTSTQPNIIAWIEFWQKMGLIGPVVESVDSETGYPVLTFKTYSGEDYSVTLDNIAGLVDGKVPIELMPTSVQEVTGDVARLMDEVETDTTGLMDRMTAAEGDIDSLDSSVGTLQTEVEASSTGLLDRMTSAENELTAQDGRLDALEATVDTPSTGLVAKVGVLQTEVEDPSTGLLKRATDLESWQSTINRQDLNSRLTTAEGDIDALEGRMATAEGDIDALETTVGDNNSGLVKAVQDLQRVGLRYKVVAQLTPPGEPNTLYLVLHQGTKGGRNYFDEYLWVSEGGQGYYELIGTTQFTLDITGDAYNVRLNGTAIPNASTTTAGIITAAQFTQFSARMARYEETIALSKNGTNVIHDLGAIPASVTVYVNNMLVRCRTDIIDTNTIRLKPTSDIAQARVIISL